MIKQQALILEMIVLFPCDVMTEMVECQSSFEYADRPVALRWNDQRLEIKNILNRWKTPEGRCFRVETTSEEVFELTYIEMNNEWRIHQPQGVKCKKILTGVTYPNGY